MGYICHHAIIVTSWDHSALLKAYVAAVDLKMNPTQPMFSDWNRYETFLVPPDGSKEDWNQSSDGDHKRAAFIKWLNTEAYSDGSSPYRWAEVQYGDDDGDNRILRTDRTERNLKS